MKEIGQHIKEIRKERGMSGRELARRSSISQAYLSQLETGQNKNPSPEIIHKIADALNVDHTYLMFQAGYLYDADVTKLETELTKRELEKTKDDLASAANNFYGRDVTKDDIHSLLNSTNDVYYKDRLLTKDEKDKLLTIIDTVLG